LGHVRKVRPDRVIIAGDLLDALDLSHFNKVPEFGDRYDEEIAYANLFLDALRAVYRGQIDIIEGNHEMRLKQLVWGNAPALSGMSGFSISERLQLKERGIGWHEVQDGAAKFVDNYIEDQGFLVGHFNIARKGAGNTVRGLLDTYGKNIVQSHCHRMALIYKRQYDRTLIGVECGCMCSLKPTWMKQTDWSNGFVDLVDGVPEMHPIL
jgi:hypothetical protein